MRLLWLSALLLILAFAVLPDAASAQEGGEPSSRVLENAFPNLSFELPVFLTNAGDGTDRLFVVEQEGRIRVFANDRDVSHADVFLDLTDQVVMNHTEQGLLGLAFAPDYEESGYFFVYYTAGPELHSVVSRFQVSEDDPNAANPSSELVILRQPQPFRNHNGGMIAFGPDGYLHVAFGDGGDEGSARDPNGNGQNRGSWLGSILRIDVSESSEEAPYRVPPDNPFVHDEDAAPEVFAYGFRNPWRFSFAPDRTLWVGDVGQNAYEEINVVGAGKNYGWNVMEGAECFLGTSCDPSGLELPVAVYSTYSEGCAVVGGYVYRGFRVSALRDRYIFADWCSGRMFALTYDGVRPAAVERLILSWQEQLISSFGEDEQGELYMVDHMGGGIHWFREDEPYEPEPAPRPEPTSVPQAPATPSPTASTGPTLDATASPAPTAAVPTPTATAGTPAVSPTPPAGEEAADFGAGMPVGIFAGAGAAVALAGGGLTYWARRRGR